MSQAPDVFEQIFALLTPERLLADPKADGSGVALCVIDTGVDRQAVTDLLERMGRVLQPVEGGVFTGRGAEPLPYDGRQHSSHGTTVADIILRLAPAIRLFSADVFGAHGSARVEAVVHAIRWAVDVWQCKIINLSLGVPEQQLVSLPRRQYFLDAVEYSYYRDVALFAAAHNEHPFTRSYPAQFAPPLMSVDKELFDDPIQFAYRLCERVEFQAHGRGYFGPFAQEPATSWAAPHLAGISARLLSLRPGLKPFELKTLLYWLCRGWTQPPPK